MWDLSSLKDLLNEYTQVPSFWFLAKMVVLVSLWCNGIYVTSRKPDDALYFLLAIGKKLPKALAKPLITCINCMASLHGLFISGMVFWLTGTSWSYYIATVCPMIVICAFLNGVLILIHNILENKLYMQHIQINQQNWQHDNDRSGSGTDNDEAESTDGG